eukprot:CAMPEP_0114509896 /NCGR_PEP_ID=MMETSP0109-20121206/13474_1 /TAXON_ID=29199 /ORGANISM="Chlorarachnion reptans, Strain CCCM449" /LENGTH=234 /DNA_ID=CAMNT_0001689119 /DNA_START=42 /DNA_END=744 /DNA_ORIENTATION=-
MNEPVQIYESGICDAHRRPTSSDILHHRTTDAPCFESESGRRRAPSHRISGEHGGSLAVFRCDHSLELSQASVGVLERLCCGLREGIHGKLLWVSVPVELLPHRRRPKPLLEALGQGRSFLDPAALPVAAEFAAEPDAVAEGAGIAQHAAALHHPAFAAAAQRGVASDAVLPPGERPGHEQSARALVAEVPRLLLRALEAEAALVPLPAHCAVQEQVLLELLDDAALVAGAPGE